ncbi:autotransporter outer membrane beta-barrel domain-containing protein, partial [Herbaspirillum sp. C7C2]|uniref:autotransporter outer membrane beta-barrel domain-containing protein n=1 Tax=Herbaspirillum sp. C7C2 TaxID=2736666 RepID=UPI001F52155D
MGSNTALGSGSLSMSDGTTLRAAADGLALANALSLSGTGNIDTQAYNMTLSGAISDGASAGSLTKRGRGRLTLTGAPRYSGNTTIAEGTLAMASYRQTADQTLRFGAFSDVSYGKLQVKGRASFVPQAKLAVDVARINTLGKGQTLDTVISAGSLDASSFSVSDNSLLFDFKAVISGNAVSLDIVDGVSISQVVKDGQRGAANAAATALDNQIRLVGRTPLSDMATVISAMGHLPDAASVARATSQTLPRNTNTAAIMGSLSSLNRIVSSRFAPTAAGQGGPASGVSSGESADFQAWIMPFDARVNQGDREGSAGFSANTWGLVGGIEAPIGEARVGVSYAYGNTSVSGNTALAGTASRSRIDASILGLYGSLPVGSMTLGLQLDAGWNLSHTQRELRFGGLNRSAVGDYGGLSTHAGAALAQVLPLTPSLSLTPALQLDYTRLQSNAYTERGADALDLHVENRIVASRFAPATVAQSGPASGLSSGESADRQAWIMPFDARVNQGDRDGSAGFSANTWGLAGGIEGDLGMARLGLSYAYGNTNVSGNTALSGTGSKSRIESNVVALYASLPVQSMTLGLQVDAGWNVSRSQRELRFGGLNRSASADYGSLSTHAGASLSQALPLTQELSLVPALQLDYTRLQSRAYTEKGADALNLQVEGKTAQALVLGVETRLNYALSPESQISTHLGAGYDAINDRDDMVVRYGHQHHRRYGHHHHHRRYRGLHYWRYRHQHHRRHGHQHHRQHRHHHYRRHGHQHHRRHRNQHHRRYRGLHYWRYGRQHHRRYGRQH